MPVCMCTDEMDSYWVGREQRHKGEARGVRNRSHDSTQSNRLQFLHRPWLQVGAAQQSVQAGNLRGACPPDLSWLVGCVSDQGAVGVSSHSALALVLHCSQHASGDVVCDRGAEWIEGSPSASEGLIRCGRREKTQRPAAWWTSATRAPPSGGTPLRASRRHAPRRPYSPRCTPTFRWSLHPRYNPLCCFCVQGQVAEHTVNVVLVRVAKVISVRSPTS